MRWFVLLFVVLVSVAAIYDRDEVGLDPLRDREDVSLDTIEVRTNEFLDTIIKRRDVVPSGIITQAPPPPTPAPSTCALSFELPCELES